MTKYFAKFYKRYSFKKYNINSNCLSLKNIRDNLNMTLQKKFSKLNFNKGLFGLSDILSYLDFLILCKSKNINGRNIISDVPWSI